MWAVLHTKLNTRVSQIAGNLLTRREPLSFQGVRSSEELVQFLVNTEGRGML